MSLCLFFPWIFIFMQKCRMIKLLIQEIFLIKGSNDLIGWQLHLTTLLKIWNWFLLSEISKFRKIANKKKQPEKKINLQKMLKKSNLIGWLLCLTMLICHPNMSKNKIFLKTGRLVFADYKLLAAYKKKKQKQKKQQKNLMNIIIIDKFTVLDNS